MSKRLLEEPIELTDAELELVSGGEQSPNGSFHEDGRTLGTGFPHGESPTAQSHETERGD